MVRRVSASVLILLVAGTSVQAAEVEFQNFGERYARVFAERNGSATFQPVQCPAPTICQQDLGQNITMTFEGLGGRNRVEVVTLSAPADGRRASFRFWSALIALTTLLSPNIDGHDRTILLDDIGGGFDRNGKAQAVSDGILYDLEEAPGPKIVFHARLRTDAAP